MRGDAIVFVSVCLVLGLTFPRAAMWVVSVLIGLGCLLGLCLIVKSWLEDRVS